MSVSMIAGQAATNSVLSNQLVIDMENEIHALDPDSTPLATLLGTNGTKGDWTTKFARPGEFNGLSVQRGEATNPKHEWLEDQLNPRTDAINFSTGYTTINTTIVVDNGAYFVAGQIILNGNTREVMRVSAVSSNTLTVVRNLNADASGFVGTDNDEIVILGSAYAEGSASPTANITKKTTLFNYSQIYRRSVDLTRTEIATKQYGGSELAQQRAKAGTDMLRDLEWSLFFGQKSIDTSAAALRTMAGVNAYLSTNKTAISGLLTEAALNSHLRNVFNAGGGPKFMFASPLTCDAIAGFSKNKLHTVVGDSTYGVKILKYVVPHGEIFIVRQPVFKGGTSALGGYAITLDMKNIQMFYLTGAAPQLRMNIQNNDVDGEKDEFLTEATCAVYNESSHGILTGITG